MEIPIHPAASLRVEAFLDLDGDGLKSEGEEPLSNLVVQVDDSEAAWVLRTSDDGSAELRAVRPGVFTAAVDPATLPRRARAPGLQTVTVRGGESATLLLAIPPRTVSVVGTVGLDEEDGGGR